LKFLVSDLHYNRAHDFLSGLVDRFYFGAGRVLWRVFERDVFAQLLAALVVAVLTLPGLIVYLILRPPRTLAEIYEQSLEEEALLQEIEEKRVCPGCGRQAQENWRVCPNCYTKLKKACAQCGELMDLPWNLCPYCATPVEGMRLPADAPAEDNPLSEPAA
jgi:RNA polymerase subunit RPABC4/transcription elongation factor Spt4